MKSHSFKTIALGVAGLLVFAAGWPEGHTFAPTSASAADAPQSVSADGFALKSESVNLPIDEQLYPPGPGVDEINTNCTSCHSASMAMTQPVLTAAQWKATVLKMRDVFKAPLDESAIPAIVDYLTAMSAKQAAAAASTESKLDASPK